MFAIAGTSVSLRFSVNSSNHSGRSHDRPSDVDGFLFLWERREGFFGVSRQFLGARSSLRSVAGLEDVLDEVLRAAIAEDELSPELDDNPVQQ